MYLRKIDFVVAGSGAILAAILSAITLAILTPLNEMRGASVVLGSLFVYLPFCLLGAFFIGLPIFVALLKMNLIQWWIWVPLSLVLGVGLDYLFGDVPGQSAPSLIAALSVPFISAAAFRLVLAISSNWRINSAGPQQRT
jgi:CDP-diglyceride synthetase